MNVSLILYKILKITISDFNIQVLQLHITQVFRIYVFLE